MDSDSVFEGKQKRHKCLFQIEDKVLGTQVSKGFSLCKVV